MYDYLYSHGDRVMSDGNYVTTTGAASAMLREMACEPITVDGTEYGNRAVQLADRGIDTEASRATILRAYQEVAARHEALGGVRDVTIEIAQLTNLASGVGVHVTCYDVQLGAETESMLPWGGLV